MNDIGTFLFAVALLLVWFLPRTAAIVSSTAALLGLPLFLYFTVPVVFYRLFNNLEFSVPLRANVWDSWAILGILFTVITLYINLRIYWERHRRFSEEKSVAID